MFNPFQNSYNSTKTLITNGLLFTVRKIFVLNRVSIKKWDSSGHIQTFHSRAVNEGYYYSRLRLKEQWVKEGGIYPRWDWMIRGQRGVGKGLQRNVIIVGAVSISLRLSLSDIFISLPLSVPLSPRVFKIDLSVAQPKSVPLCPPLSNFVPLFLRRSAQRRPLSLGQYRFFSLQGFFQFIFIFTTV